MTRSNPVLSDSYNKAKTVPILTRCKYDIHVQ